MSLLNVINQVGASDGPSYVMVGSYIVINPVTCNPLVMNTVSESVNKGLLLPLHHDGSRGALLFEKLALSTDKKE